MFASHNFIRRYRKSELTEANRSSALPDCQETLKLSDVCFTYLGMLPGNTKLIKNLIHMTSLEETGAQHYQLAKIHQSYP